MNRTEAIERIVKIAKSIKVAMFTTVDNTKKLRSRPMACVKVEQEDASCWFFTNEYSGKVDELQQGNSVNLAFSDINNQSYLSLSGSAKLVTDSVKMKELWHPMVQAWFPDGLESDRLALLKFTPQKGEFWDGSDSKIVQLYQISKAILTGEQVDAGENEKIKI